MEGCCTGIKTFHEMLHVKRSSLVASLQIRCVNGEFGSTKLRYLYPALEVIWLIGHPAQAPVRRNCNIMATEADELYISTIILQRGRISSIAFLTFSSIMASSFNTEDTSGDEGQLLCSKR